jgi:carbonic anhydrase/acetyltransferase-like protein (isoleucine patch superfamily)
VDNHHTDTISLGPRTNVQDGAVIHVDTGAPCLIGAGVTIDHQAVVHGALVEDDVLIGIGAIVSPSAPPLRGHGVSGACIGRDSIIGAGSLVTGRNVIPPRSMVLGVPGRVVRSLTDEEMQSIRAVAEHYVEYGARYKEGM